MKNSILLFGLVIVIGASCSKPDEIPVKTKKEILTSGKWLVLSSKGVAQVSGGTQESDLYAMLQPCQKDNLYIFNSNGAGSIDEGGSKCVDTDPQVVNTGNWELRDNDKKLKMKVSLGLFNADVLTDIVELNDNTMTLKFDTTYLTYPATVTTTFTHVKQ